MRSVGSAWARSIRATRVSVLIVAIALHVLPTVLIGCASKPTLVRSPTLYVESQDDPFADTPAELRTTSVRLLYATDREAQLWKDDSFGYGPLRSQRVAYGRCTVSMGDADLTWEELAQASRMDKRSETISLSLTSVDELGFYPPFLAMVEVNGEWVESQEELQEQQEATHSIHELVREELQKTPRKEVYVYVHGYNNTFADGAYRAAQLWHFAGRGGVPVLFSWPAGSSGLLQGYTRDRESGEFANPHLKRFIQDLATCDEVQKIHFIAHSRGTDILGTAIRELRNEYRAAGKNIQTELKIGQIVMAAPDIDLDVFIERFGRDRMGFVAEQVTIYASPDDRAIGLSSWLFGSLRRVGQVQLKDLSTEAAKALRQHPIASIVDVHAKSDATGHGYFLSSPACLSDLILVLRDGRKPGAAHGRPLVDDPDAFWQLHDGYPSQNSKDR